LNLHHNLAVNYIGRWKRSCSTFSDRYFRGSAKCCEKWYGNRRLRSTSFSPWRESVGRAIKTYRKWSSW